MELDFTGLNAIGDSRPLEERLACYSTSSLIDSKNAATGLYGGLAGLQEDEKKLAITGIRCILVNGLKFIQDKKRGGIFE